MDPKCSAAVRAAAGGRQISDAKLAAIEDAISGTMRELARRDRAGWAAMSRDQRIAAASAKAMEDLQAEAGLKEYRAGLQAVRTAELETAITTDMATYGETRSKSLVRSIERAQQHGTVIRNEALSNLGELLDAAGNRDGTGLLRNLGMRIFDLDNPQMTADVVREVFKLADGSTGNKAAQAAAKAWLETTESLRQRFNSAGGNIGKLGYGYLAQAHDWVRVKGAGTAADAQAWAQKVMPLLDREQYVRADGSLMNEAEVGQMLRGAWETIQSQGANKTEPGQFKGSGAKANKGSEHRVLHFKDGDAWMAYMKDYGEGSLYDAMLGHVGAMSRDLGLVERFGPNPEQQFRVQLDIAQRADGVGTTESRFLGNQPQAYWDIATGKTGMPENRLVARVGQDVRNVQTAAKLGGAVLSAVSDVGTIMAALHFNRLSYFDMLSSVGKLTGQRLKETFGMGKAEFSDFLQSHEVIADSLSNTLNRWTGDHMTHSLTGRVANAVMKVSLMNAWTDGLRAAFSATMMRGFAKKLGKGWGELDDWDKHLMGRHGITEADWATISAAKATDRNGAAYLTPDSIRATGRDGAQAAGDKWAAFVSDEAQFAIINPDSATRAIVTAGGLQGGTIGGEAMRTVMQFKSFPLAMITRHWNRVLETPQGLEGAPLGYGATTAAGRTVNKVATLAALNVSLTLLGAVALQIKGLARGEDPQEMVDQEGKPNARFWMKATMQGGGASFLGDVLFNDPTEQRGNSVERTFGVLGPTAGSVAGLVGDLGVKNVWEMAQGKDTKAGAEALRWVNSHTPGSNLWWTRAAWEHWVLHNAQEALNPGYLARMKQRAQKDKGVGFWWEPGEPLPERAPDMANMIGR